MGFAKMKSIGPGRAGRIVFAFGVVIALAGCEDGVQFNLFQKKPDQDGAASAATASGGGRTVERDVEVPEAFQVTEAGLWDGRPSLGGVWVAHPDVKEPERVIIRNTTSDKFVVGALFRRERENPGPRLQVSSDAAEALGMLAGQPVQLNVTALRREEVAQEANVEDEATLDAPDTVETQTLDPVAGEAAAAETEEAKPAAPAPKPRPKASGLEKPFIQIGIFSVEQNAENTAVAMRQSGMVPTVKKQELRGKTFWRVLVGPATNSSERAALLKKIKSAGFSDAYFVNN
ncbi:SPOR domain-containing protein [Aquicoccus porphyridii]|uniref:SPOR domain-containing protein n=1 Tax=Aquicoccus porphyridii TaxID=1852029 RepID=UPI00273DC726|nr:SPOR domain-containing protein [Aquicoccus porphyridii]